MGAQSVQALLVKLVRSAKCEVKDVAERGIKVRVTATFTDCKLLILKAGWEFKELDITEH